MAHTPGPWGYDGTEVHAEHLVICNAYRSRTDDEGNWMPNEEVEANARLIAAAPELLEAARLANQELIDLGQGSSASPALRALWSAIAKAEGRE